MKKKKRSTKAFNITASLLVAFSLIAPSVASAESTNKLHESLRESSVSNVLAKDKISDRLLTNFKDEEKVTFLVKFKDKAEAQEVAKEARKTSKGKEVIRSKMRN